MDLFRNRRTVSSKALLDDEKMFEFIFKTVCELSITYDIRWWGVEEEYFNDHPY